MQPRAADVTVLQKLTGMFSQQSLQELANVNRMSLELLVLSLNCALGVVGGPKIA